MKLAYYQSKAGHLCRNGGRSIKTLGPHQRKKGHNAHPIKCCIEIQVLNRLQTLDGGHMLKTKPTKNAINDSQSR